ncbi:DNA-directed RNA polymerases I, II, and III subunit RPABC3 [Neocucurbitaria cava]|uniref:DNA-directed RNA polymerases I, II, and III subunit RPABC3 n=1 Tax=Neocucurbitaria cava TaxID=798079 RepID=A0A9W8Y569_9PLEO|nr:DNA-directed RNA polymerases I, II, and III subunit RPABC3 [Neocucurbitaria cava]
MADAQVFEETFSITSINNEKYDRVSRIFGTSTDNQITMTLDINHELFPVQTGETLNMVLATTLSLDGTSKEQNETMWRSVGKHGVTTLADMYDYVCYGKNYRMEDGDGDQMKYYASFGGLLLYMEGPYRKLGGLKIDNIYMLVKHS